MAVRKPSHYVAVCESVECPALIRVAISPAAFDAITATLPLESVGFEREPNANGERMIWLDAAVVDQLAGLRRKGESYSDVIVRLAAAESGLSLPDETL